MSSLRQGRDYHERDRAGDHRIATRIHLEPAVAKWCRNDAGPEGGAVAKEKFPGDT